LESVAIGRRRQIMGKKERGTIYKSVERVTPSVVKAVTKRAYWRFRRLHDRYRYIETERFVELGRGFRFDRGSPYRARIGERTIVEAFNIWNTQLGDIVVGKKCWFGLYDIVMGPVEIGDDTHTGPFVRILGPHHPILDVDDRKQKTIIGSNVRMLTGAIILFGVKIGDNAVISAGSVVTKDVPEGAFVGGNPARNLSKLAGVLWKGAAGQPQSNEQIASSEKKV
jgi:acetyltransferase-like isoleucine patch superfamily enzyme